MSNTDLLEREIEFLEETIDLSKSVPCQMQFVVLARNIPVAVKPCGKPSVVRVTTTCQVCLSRFTLFYCKPCLDLVQNGQVSCTTCIKAGYLTRKLSWNET